ncbi:hypothetical protein [Actinoplanes sp. NPDC026619]
MGALIACVAGLGAATAAVGAVYSRGWLILFGGFTLLVGALAVSSTRPPG